MLVFFLLSLSWLLGIGELVGEMREVASPIYSIYISLKVFRALSVWVKRFVGCTLFEWWLAVCGEKKKNMLVYSIY